MKQLTITGTTPAAAGTAVVGSPVGDISAYSDVTVLADLVGATGGVLDVALQREVAPNVWADWIHFTQLGAGAAAVRYAATINKANTAPLAVGIHNTATPGAPVIGAGVVAPGHPGQRVRCVATAGASTSAGATITIYLSASSPTS